MKPLPTNSASLSPRFVLKASTRVKTNAMVTQADPSCPSTPTSSMLSVGLYHMVVEIVMAMFLEYSQGCQSILIGLTPSSTDNEIQQT